MGENEQTDIVRALDEQLVLLQSFLDNIVAKCEEEAINADPANKEVIESAYDIQKQYLLGEIESIKQQKKLFEIPHRQPF